MCISNKCVVHDIKNKQTCKFSPSVSQLSLGVGLAGSSSRDSVTPETELKHSCSAVIVHFVGFCFVGYT